MSNILDICLISDQPIPNYLPALIGTVRPQKVIALVSEQMRAKNKHVSLMQSLSALGIETEERTTLPFDIDRVKADAVKVAKDHQGWTCRCNLTGGTKMMTVGLFEAAREKGLSAYYVDTLDDQIIHLLPHMQSQQIEPTLTIDNYLNLYNYKITGRSAPTPSGQRLELLTWLTRNPSADVYRFIGMLSILAHNANSDFQVNNITSHLYNTPPNFFKFLDRFSSANILSYKNKSLNFDSKDALRFTLGGWLEEYVFHTVMSLSEHITDAACSLEIEKQSREVRNELDVVFTSRNRLFTIECKAKSFITTKSSATKEESAAPVYKLDSLREVISGTFGRAMLVSFKQLPPATCQRLADLRIKYIHGADISRIDKIIKDWITQ